MNGNNAPLEVDYEPVSPKQGTPASSFPETTGKVVEFPRNLEQVSQKLSEKPPYTSQQLADAVEVSPQAWRKWFPRFCQVVDEVQLRDGRKYTELCAELTLSYSSHRDHGMTIDTWIVEIAIPTFNPRQQQQNDDVEHYVFEAEQQGAIVPASVHDAADGAENSLSLATTQAAAAGAMLDALFDSLVSASNAAGETSVLIDEQKIIADETLKIVAEERIRADVRARFQQRKRQVQDQAIVHQMNQVQEVPQ